jgi:Holliday junction resolvase RusA-like endonuclease
MPASASKKKQQSMLHGGIRPTKKPDCDNIAKAVLDALNGIAYYDDSQVVTVTVEKLYSDTPRVEVEITEEV